MKICKLIALMSIVLMVGCQQSSSTIDTPNVSDISVDSELIRFDQLISTTPPDQMADSLESWQQQFPNFIDIYLTNILALPTTKMEPSEIVASLNDFNEHQGISIIQSKIDSIYGDMSDVEADYQKAFQYFKYYFPEFQAPDIYTCNTEFAFQRFLFEENDKDAIGIGLDLFLGDAFPYQQTMPSNPNFSDYLTRSFNKDHMVKKTLDAMLETMLVAPESGNLLDQMVFNGKKLYILDHLIPFQSDTAVMEYTKDQLAWCDNNQAEMWAYLLKNNLFYSNDINKISKLITPSPSSSGMPEESPGRTANYLGWKIVEAYMDKNPDMSMKDLILENNAQKILEISRFKPKRR